MGGNVENYRGYQIEGLPPIILKIYNDTAGAITAGDAFFLSFAKDADSLSPSARPTLDAMATSATVRRQIVVALEDVADQAYGEFMLRGYCPKLLSTGVTAEHYIQGQNSSETIADDGTSWTLDSCGIALTATDSDNFITAYLFGLPCNIGA